MVRLRLKSLAVVLGALAIATAATAADQRWSYISADHPQFGTGFHGAAIQYDDSFARLQFIPHRNLWFSTIGVVPSERVTELTSILTDKHGKRLRLTMKAPDIRVETDPTGRMTIVNFIIRPEDIRHFKSAVSWTIETDLNRHFYSLDGSAAAIKQASNRR